MNRIVLQIGLGVILAVGLIAGLMWIMPQYNIWSAEQNGRAILAEAEFSRKTKIEEARATQESAELIGQAELTRAEFTAQANLVLADGLGGPEGYLRWLYINTLSESGSAGQIIYIPTEAGMPILEAGRATESILGN